MSNAYEKLMVRVKDAARLESVGALLDWDQETYMPTAGVTARADQIALISGLQHDTLVCDETRALIEKADAPSDDHVAVTNLREVRRAFDRASKLPTELVKEIAHTTTLAKQAWAKAREQDDFGAFEPLLTKVVTLKRRVVDLIGYETDPYDALMDEFEPGAKAAEVEAVFKDLVAATVRLLDRIRDAPHRPDPTILRGHFPREKQETLSRKMAECIGFDSNRGRADVTVHPFCTTIGGSDDVRITTRYDEDDFTTALMGILHETGHALYEKGLPKAWRRQPVGGARGMDIHESQSLLIEMQVCRSREFLQFAAPYIQKAFAQTGPAWSPENLYRIYTRVDRGLIRVDADEVTYPLHIILRYNLETALLSGDLAVQDLPAAWNDAMDRLLGIRPDNDGDGCMQDIHWFDGAIGYFPSYTLGALTAAQFFAAAKRDDDKILAAIAAGDFKPLYAWLGKNIHGLGSLYETPELIRKATGEALNPDIFVRHLQDRYLA